MNKSKMRPEKAGRNTRMTFSTQKEVQEMPNLIDIQTRSYIWFLEEGLEEVFNDIFPIQDFGGNLSLDYVGLRLCTDEKKYSVEECKERDATYSAPLKVRVRLFNKAKGGEQTEHDIYMGDLPIMTGTGSFIYNGAERVVVSQMVRSPGVYFDLQRDKFGKELYSATLIPSRGAWIEYEMDEKNVLYARVDRERKVPLTVFLRALGVGTNQEIRDMFPDEPLIEATIAKDSSLSEQVPEGSYETGLLDFYKKMRPGEPLTVDQAESLLDGMLFKPQRYDLAKAGRYKYNKKLHFKYRLKNKKLAEDVVDIETGEIIARKGTILTEDSATDIQDAGTPYVYIEVEDAQGEGVRKQKVMSSMAVDIKKYVDITDKEAEELGINELVHYPILMEILQEKGKGSQKALKEEIHRRRAELVPKHITKDDIFASINYLLHLESSKIGQTDDIDHLGNRRIRAVGELLQNEYRKGLSRMERVVRERMTTQNMEEITAQSLINIKPVTAAIKEFFGSSQLSQFMDQNNPLSELTHKRRLSALGPGGITRDRAGFEVRDVHYTHYGRVCPIETPEGPNIGLINSLASFARVNKYGFIEAPYRKVIKDKNGIPVVTDETVYMTADIEDIYKVAQASEPLDKDGHFINDIVSGRFMDETSSYSKDEVDFMDVSPRMVFSVATSMIPFLENDDANRALMGSNMQRQAVPLMITEEPVIGTGMESKAAVDSGICITARERGTVEYVDASRIEIRGKDTKELDIYRLNKFSRSNQSNSYNQKPIVDLGQEVEQGEVIADGASSHNGELALGKNPLIGFMTWEGYNYEDAVLLSERLVKEDVYTSIHIEEYTLDSRDTKLGPEEITADVPGIGDEALKDLNEDGIIRLGAEVRAGDILVGKVTPKGETELTAEEKLLRAIFGEKAREVRDTSLRLPHGAYGIVVDTKVFTRAEKGKDRDTDIELPAGVSKSVRVYIAQKRKISVGDKMAGRHGNKGVVSRVLPVEDMPYLPNGRPLDIVLNPLGVPSRMNIGQVLEIHLSLAAKALGIDISTPAFDGANEDDIQDTLTMANDYVNGSWDDFKKKYKDILNPEVLKYLGSHLEHREEWKNVPITPDGKVRLRDGRTGEYFDSKVTIGHMHYLKLHHLVDDKIHARSTGPYALVTQQPLGGKAQFGGQRFGEMEVWALEAYGAAYTLQEILTVKADDVIGRVKTYEAIIQGDVIEPPTIPESFKVLLKELQALCLDVSVLSEEGKEIEMTEDFFDPKEKLNKLIEGDRRYQDKKNIKKYGFQEQEVQNNEFVDVKEEAKEDGSSD
ncbi:MAG: DNA-directed RNA polymerase subunit beta [Eubacteriales bacterium]|nr:DNA-directed RNA polymerase subunit beta [Eubacteriales bacterium]